MSRRRTPRFTTLTPKNTFIGHFTPEDGSTVGVGMPFSIHFTRGITDPEAVEKAISVKTEPAVDVEGHWFGNDRLDFRPEKYWKAGTKVTVKLNLDGVEGRPGVYGKQAKTVKFTIGRSQVSTVDAKTHTMKVVRDGKQIKTIPITAGAPGYDHVQRPDGHQREAPGDPDERRHRRLRRRVRHQGRPARHAPDHLRHLHPRQLLGAAAPSATTNASHGCVGLRDVRGGYDSKTPGGVVLRQLDDRRRGRREELQRQDDPARQRPQRLEHGLGEVEGRDPPVRCHAAGPVHCDQRAPGPSRVNAR